MTEGAGKVPHPKIKSYSVVSLARDCLAKNRFDIHAHCEARMLQRVIDDSMLFEVVEEGELIKDTFNAKRLPPWSYVLRKEIDEQQVTVVIHFWKTEQGEPWLVFYTCWLGDEE